MPDFSPKNSLVAETPSTTPTVPQDEAANPISMNECAIVARQISLYQEVARFAGAEAERLDKRSYEDDDDEYGDVDTHSSTPHIGSPLDRKLRAEFQLWREDIRRASSPLKKLAAALQASGCLCVASFDENPEFSIGSYSTKPEIRAYWPVAAGSRNVAEEMLRRITEALGLSSEVLGGDLLSKAFDNAEHYSSSPFMRPRENEKADEWYARNAVSDQDLKRFSAQWERAGYCPEIFLATTHQQPSSDGGWLIAGVLRRGITTLVVGAPGTGKSTLATEAVLAVADPNPAEWLGRPIAQRAKRGLVAILSGEDNEAILSERIEMLDPTKRCDLPYIQYGVGTSGLAGYLENLKRVPAIDLLVVDPARSFLVGDEDSSGPVSEFFDMLNEFARQKDCAVLVVHHLGKNARPRSLEDVRLQVRGSGVFLDRPRHILGMYRLRDDTVIGSVKSSFPPRCSVIQREVFRRDSSSLRHLPVDISCPIRRTDSSDFGVAEIGGSREESRAAIASVVRKLNRDGYKIFRTGAHGLFKHPELAPIGRQLLDALTCELIADGTLVSGKNGLSVSERDRAVPDVS